MRPAALIGLYIGVLLAGLVIFNADAENNYLALGVWSIASLFVGWSLARWPAALLPFLAIPMAVPFGYANEWLGSDAPLVWWFAIFAGVIAAALILLATVGRKLHDRRRGHPAVTGT